MCCFQLPKRLDVRAASIFQSRPAERQSTRSQFGAPSTGEGTPGHLVHSSAAAGIHSPQFSLLPFALQPSASTHLLYISSCDCSFIVSSHFLPPVFTASPILSLTSLVKDLSKLSISAQKIACSLIILGPTPVQIYLPQMWVTGSA